MKNISRWLKLYWKILLVPLIIIIIITITYKNKKEDVSTIVNKNSFAFFDVTKHKNDNAQQNTLIYNKSMHGGEGFFAGAFRFELTATSSNVITLYMDNALGEPTYPNHTELMIQYKNEKYPLRVIRNGILQAQLKEYKLGENFILLGKFIGKDLAVAKQVKEYVK